MTNITIEGIHGDDKRYTFPEGTDPYDLIRSVADHFNIPIKMWEPSDLDEYLDWYPAEHREELRVAAQETRSWARALTECTETDWIFVANAVVAAAEELGVEELPD